MWQSLYSNSILSENVLKIRNRLLSGYRNKIEPMRDDTFGKWSRDIITYYRKDQNDTKPTTFNEFLEWWVDGTHRGSDNEHWQTYRNLINPCLYQWDYILKLENIEEESKWLFSEFNITKITYPPGKIYLAKYPI